MFIPGGIRHDGSDCEVIFYNIVYCILVFLVIVELNVINVILSIAGPAL